MLCCCPLPHLFPTGSIGLAVNLCLSLLHNIMSLSGRSLSGVLSVFCLFAFVCCMSVYLFCSLSVHCAALVCMSVCMPPCCALIWYYPVFSVYAFHYNYIHVVMPASVSMSIACGPFTFSSCLCQSVHVWVWCIYSICIHTNTCRYTHMIHCRPKHQSVGWSSACPM